MSLPQVNDDVLRVGYDDITDSYLELKLELLETLTREQLLDICIELHYLVTWALEDVDAAMCEIFDDGDMEQGLATLEALHEALLPSGIEMESKELNHG